jgi:hypothetical protein
MTCNLEVKMPPASYPETGTPARPARSATSRLRHPPPDCAHCSSHLANMKLIALISLMQTLATPFVASVAIKAPTIALRPGFREKHPNHVIKERASCAIHMSYVKPWKEWGYSRYESRATAEGSSDPAMWPNKKIMFEKWCVAFKGYVSTAISCEEITIC